MFPHAGVSWQTVPGSRTNGFFILPPWSCPLLPAPFGPDTRNVSAGQRDPAQVPESHSCEELPCLVPCHPCEQCSLCGQALLANTVRHFTSWRCKLSPSSPFLLRIYAKAEIPLSPPPGPAWQQDPRHQKTVAEHSRTGWWSLCQGVQSIVGSDPPATLPCHRRNAESPTSWLTSMLCGHMMTKRCRGHLIFHSSTPPKGHGCNGYSWLPT